MRESISNKLFPLRNLHAGLSDFTQACAFALARAKSPVEREHTREEFEQVPGKHFGGLFFQFYQRYVDSPLRSLAREPGKSVPPRAFRYCRQYLDQAVARLCVSAPVSVQARHMGSVVHYTRERRRAESRGDDKTFTRFLYAPVLAARASAHRVRHM